MSTFLEDRIAAVKAQIEAVDQTLLAFAVSGRQTATMDTGQTRVTYTRADIASLQRVQERLLVLLQSLERMAGNGPGGLYARPGF